MIDYLFAGFLITAWVAILLLMLLGACVVHYERKREFKKDALSRSRLSK